MKRTIYSLAGYAVGSLVVGYLISAEWFVVLFVNVLAWFLVGIYWLGRWQSVREHQLAIASWRRHWFYEI